MITYKCVCNYIAAGGVFFCFHFHMFHWFKRQRDISYLLVHSPHATLQTVARAGPGKALAWVSHRNSKALRAWAITHCLPGCTWAEGCSQEWSQDSNPGTARVGCEPCSWRLTSRLNTCRLAYLFRWPSSETSQPALWSPRLPFSFP